MKLIIAEKPELARAISKAVSGAEEKCEGYIKKGEYLITWAFGHLLTLKEPEDYDKEKYKSWKIEQLPIYFEEWEHKEGKESYKRSQLKIIKNLLKQSDSVIHAGDPDSEGQYLIDELLTFYKYNKPVKRILINDNNTEYIKKAFLTLEDNEKFSGMSKSAYARSVGDLIFGINMSRYFTVLNNSGTLTVGRVQTPTLGLVVNRDAEIKNHVKKKYYTYDLTVENEIKFKYQSLETDPVDEKNRIIDKNFFENLDKEISDSIFTVIVEKRKENVEAPLPFNLAKLQVYCSNKFDYSPQKTLDITQSLREKHKAITYNRSDSQYLNVENYLQAEEVFGKVFDNLGITPKVDFTIRSKCFDDSKVAAHHAIIPTNTKVEVSKFTEEEKNVYKAVCNYYIVQFMKPKIIEKTTAHIEINNYSFRAVSGNCIDSGWQDFLKADIGKDKEEISQSYLSLLDTGSYKLQYAAGKINEKETEPAKAYTEASLISDMTSIAKYVQNPEIKEILKKKDQDKKGENGSIGTPATRASIIEGLYKRGFIEKKGKKVVSTELGRDFYNMLPDYIKTADLTAKWWLIQEEIAENKAEPEKLILSVLEDVNKVLSTEIVMTEGYKCKRCGKNLKRLKGKNGYFWSCLGYPDCKNTFSDNNGKPDLNEKKKGEVTELKCECGNGLIKREVFKKPGKYWYGCEGYPDCKNRYFLDKDTLKKF